MSPLHNPGLGLRLHMDRRGIQHIPAGVSPGGAIVEQIGADLVYACAHRPRRRERSRSSRGGTGENTINVLHIAASRGGTEATISSELS